MVEWSIALDGTGKIIHIDEATPSKSYECYDCVEPMYPRRGESGRAPHFYHQVASDCSSSETDLHKIAKELIIDGVEAIRGRDAVYLADVVCRRCGEVAHQTELKGTTAYAVPEIYASPRLCPDVSFFDGNGLVATVEVVVTHPPSESALIEYQKIGIPAFIVTPTWRSVFLLRNGIRTVKGINVTDLCNRCSPKPITPRPVPRAITPPPQKRYVAPKPPAQVIARSIPDFDEPAAPELVQPPLRRTKAPNFLERFIKLVEDIGPNRLAMLEKIAQHNGRSGSSNQSSNPIRGKGATKAGRRTRASQAKGTPKPKKPGQPARPNRGRGNPRAAPKSNTQSRRRWGR
jgi:hypothetical protein